MDYWGAKGYVGPPLKLLGGIFLPPPFCLSFLVDFQAANSSSGSSSLNTTLRVSTVREKVIFQGQGILTFVKEFWNLKKSQGIQNHKSINDKNLKNKGLGSFFGYYHSYNNN